MEIVSIERKTFEELVAKFDRFVSRMDAICHRHGEKRMSEWMDNQDVCRMINISPRTLQTLRDNGTLSYSQINHYFMDISKTEFLHGWSQRNMDRMKHISN